MDKFTRKALMIVEGLCANEENQIEPNIEWYKETLSHIYRTIHAANTRTQKKGCKHPDWESEVLETFNTLKENGLI